MFKIFKTFKEKILKVLRHYAPRSIMLGKERDNVPFKKLVSFDYTEILSQWIYFKFPYDHVIVLSNINVQAKNIQFWAKIPQKEVPHFLKDIVILRCKDVSELVRLVDNIGPDFAD